MTDMLCIAFSDGISQDSEEVADGLVLDFDSAGRVIGIEIEDASQIVDISRLDVSGLPLANIANGADEDVMPFKYSESTNFKRRREDE